MPLDLTSTPEQEVLAPGEGMIRVAGAVDPLHRHSPVIVEMPAGVSVQDIVAAVQPKAQWRKFIRVYIDGHLIPHENWRTVRPKPGTRIELAAPPQGPVAGAVASLVVAIAAAAAPSAVFTSAFLATTTGMIAGAALSAAISIAGALAINALIPPPSIGRDSVDRPDTSVERLPGIQGARNLARKYQPIPVVLGRHFIVPALAAEPYTEISGDDEYLRQVFVVGLGPLKIEDIKIGENPIANFGDVQVQVREGWPSDDPVSLYPGPVFQEGFELEIRNDNDPQWTVRTTAEDIDAFSVDITFPQGLFAVNQTTGQTLAVSVAYEIEYREVGTSTWNPFVSITRRQAHRRTIRFTHNGGVPRGQYEIRMRRLSSDRDLPNYTDDFFWTALRGIRHEDPITPSVPLATIAVRVKATRQISGAIDQLSCIATSIAPDYNGSSWVTRATRNPASLYRLALQGPMSKRPTSDGRIDLEGLAEWHQANAANGRFCDAVLSEQQDMHQVLSSIASTGRASFDIRDGKYSIVRDIPQTVPAQLLTPRNLISLSGERAFTQIPDALIVEFISEAGNWQRDEIVVYDDGKNAGNAEIFDRINLWGVTNAAQAWRFGRYNLAVAKLRPERLTAQMSWESLRLSRGYMTEVSHDVMLVGLTQARVLSVTTNASDEITGIRLDEPCLMESGETYAIKVRQRETNLARQVTTVAGESQDLLLTDPAPPGAIEVGDLVAFGLSERVTSEWIVKEIQRDADYQATLTLIPHAPEIHDADTGPIGDYDPVITLPVELRQPAPPTIVSVQTGGAVLYVASDGTMLPRIVVTVEMPGGDGEPPVDRIIVERRDSDGDNFEESWSDLGVELEGRRRAVIGEVEQLVAYDIRVASVSTAGLRSDWVYRNNEVVVGKTAPPAVPENLVVEQRKFGLRVEWDAVLDRDLKDYEVWLGDPDTGGQRLTRIASTTWDWEIRAAGSYEIHVRARDTSGNVSDTAIVIGELAVPPETDAGFEFDGPELILSWDEVEGQFATEEYEIRFGSTWETAEFEALIKTTKYRRLAQWLGTRTWWIAAIDIAGNVGAPAEVDVTVQALGQVPGLVGEVVVNNVLLRWEPPVSGSLPIDVYRVSKGETLAGAELIGEVKGTFSAVFEDEGGEFTYWVVPVDSAGNAGMPRSTAVRVDDPPNFVLRADDALDLYEADSTTNIRLTGGDALLPVDAAETWEDHFVNNGWASPQDQIDAGYPIYVQPTPASAIWEKVVDYETVLPATQIAVSIAKDDVASGATVTVFIAFRETESDPWTEIEARQVFATSFRYVRVRVEATANDVGLLRLTEIRARLSIQQKVDGDRITALAADTDGTEAFFNVDFVDVRSITLTPKDSGAPVIPVYVFEDEPFPTSFKVKAFDLNGSRVDAEISWQARGL